MHDSQKRSLLLTVLLLLATTATASDLEKPTNPGWLGLGYLLQHDDGARDDGAPEAWLHVHGVAPGGPAETAGLQARDAILAVDGKPIDFETDLEALEFFAGIEPGRKLEFRVRRGTQTFDKEVEAVELPPELRDIWWSNYQRAREQAERNPAP